jgi:hypothetical protein
MTDSPNTTNPSALFEAEAPPSREAIERLIESREEFLDENSNEGKRLARRWAEQTASWRTLLRLSNAGYTGTIGTAVPLLKAAAEADEFAELDEAIEDLDDPELAEDFASAFLFAAVEFFEDVVSAIEAGKVALARPAPTEEALRPV